MKNSIFIFTIILTACSNGSVRHEAARYVGHPIIGSWVYTQNGCDETHTFEPSGTRVSESDKEKVEARFEIETVSLESGVYLLKDEVLKDNGKADCSGSTSDMTGDVVEVLLFMQHYPNRFSFCFDSKLTQCVGPFYKKK